MSAHIIAVKYRLYPTPAQASNLRQTLAVCRDVYNSLVLWRKHDFEAQGKSPDYLTQQNVLPVWKKAHPELCAVYSQVLQRDVNAAKNILKIGVGLHTVPA